MNKYRSSDDLLNFNQSDVDINKIAHNLSQICRFAGGTDPFYSVAEHSVIVAEMLFDSFGLIKRSVNKKYAMLGLLHDAHEAYVGDITKPVKDVMFKGLAGCYAYRELKKVSDRIDAAIHNALGVIYYVDARHYIKTADAELGNAEAAKFFTGTDRWKQTSSYGRLKSLHQKIACLPSDVAAGQFLSTYCAFKGYD